MKIISGLDLGKRKDFTVHMTAEVTDERKIIIRYMKRWQTGTPYDLIISDLTRLYKRPPLSNTTLVIDYGNVGAMAVDWFREKQINAHLVSVSSTGGSSVNRSRGVFNVGKTVLVSALNIALEQSRFEICPTLHNANVFRSELDNYVISETEAGNEIYGNSPSAKHDDYVSAAMLIAWWAQRNRSMGTPLRTLPLNIKSPLERFIIVVGKDDVPSLHLDSDSAVHLISFVDCPLPRAKIAGKHSITCSDLDPNEVKGSWTTEQQEGVFSPSQCKALWYFLVGELANRNWLCLIVVGETATDPRAVSLAMAISDAFQIRRESLYVHGAGEDFDKEDEAPNWHIYALTKRGRSMICT